jgi:plasmid replication initiation protein
MSEPKKSEIVPFQRTPVAKRTVTQDNLLVEAAYKMTLNEKRLLLLGISKIDPRNFIKASDRLEFTLTAQEWAAVFPSDNAYRDMSNAAEQITSRQATIRNDAEEKRVINWVETCSYRKRIASVTIVFTRACSVYLTGLSERFTQYSFLSVGQLTSFYTIRIWEICAKFKSTGYRKIAVEELRELLVLEDKFKLFSDLRKWVIEPACKEITQKTDYSLSFEIIKEGRTAKYLAFSFQPKPQMSLELSAVAKG